MAKSEHNTELQGLLDKLPPMRAVFVEEYLKDLNASKAAIRAGYSPKTADQTASRVLKDPRVFAAVAAGKRARSERTRVDADWVLTRLADEADADVSDLYDDEMNLKPVHEWPPIWRKGLVAGIDVDELPGGMGRVRKIKLSDRTRRLELIGKHVDVQAFREQHGHSGPDGGPIQTEEIPARERLASKIARLTDDDDE